MITKPAANFKIDFHGRAVGCTLLIAALFAAGSVCMAQTADQAWLRYGNQFPRMIIPLNMRALGTSALEQSAISELKRSVADVSQSSQNARTKEAFAGTTVVGTAEEVHKAYPGVPVPPISLLKSIGCTPKKVKPGLGSPFRHRWRRRPRRHLRHICFAPLSCDNRARKMQDLSQHPLRSKPAMRIRWTNEWDNANGTVERGYGGPSIFFENDHVRQDLSQVSEYARMLASIGMNACNVNNVNGAAPFLTPEWLKGLARIADTMRPWGIRVAMSVDIASPQKIGGLDTFDPLDPQVKAWWNAKFDEVYKLIPDLAGITVKADSEGQPGPNSYGRSPADAANSRQRTAATRGVVLYRAFVYNNHLD